MNKGLHQKSFEQFSHSKIMIGYLLYVLLGTLFFITKYSNQTYINVLLSLLSHPIYLLIFIYPFPILLTVYHFKFYHQSYLVIRMKTCKKLVRNHTISTFKVLCYFLLMLLLIIGITINITPHIHEFSITKLDLGITNLSLLLLLLGKIILSFGFLALLTQLLLYAIHDEKNTILLMILGLILIYLSNYFYFQGPITSYFNICTYFYNFNLITPIEHNVFATIIFYGVFNPIIYNMAIFIFKRKRQIEI